MVIAARVPTLSIVEALGLERRTAEQVREKLASAPDVESLAAELDDLVKSGLLDARDRGDDEPRLYSVAIPFILPGDVRARARQIDADKRDIESAALIALLGVLATVKTDARFSYRHEQDIRQTVSRTMLGHGNNRGMVNEVADRMAAANLLGRRRTVEDAKAHSDVPPAALARLLGETTDGDVDALVGQYRPQAQQLVADLAARTGAAVDDAVRSGTDDGSPLRLIASALRSVGVVVPTDDDPDAAFGVVALLEFAIALAYGDGQSRVLNDPDVARELSAFTYATVGDRRVRPTHARLSGMTRPTHDSIWLTVTPPQWSIDGVPQYRCRCWLVPRYGAVEMTGVPTWI